MPAPSLAEPTRLTATTKQRNQPPLRLIPGRTSARRVGAHPARQDSRLRTRLDPFDLSTLRKYIRGHLRNPRFSFETTEPASWETCLTICRPRTKRSSRLGFGLTIGQFCGNSQSCGARDVPARLRKGPHDWKFSGDSRIPGSDWRETGEKTLN